MERLRMKAKTLLELYRNHGRHPRKLIMNLAYDPCSVNPLWEETVDRWGPAVELQGPTRVQEVLAYWDEAGDIPAVTPPMPCSPRDVGDEVTDTAAGGDVGNLGVRAPVTPEWPRQRGRAPPSSTGGGAQRQRRRVRQGSGCQEGTSEGTQ